MRGIFLLTAKTQNSIFILELYLFRMKNKEHEYYKARLSLTQNDYSFVQLRNDIVIVLIISIMKK